jgi:hypothetical protein
VFIFLSRLAPQHHVQPRHDQHSTKHTTKKNVSHPTARRHAARLNVRNPKQSPPRMVSNRASRTFRCARSRQEQWSS